MCAAPHRPSSTRLSRRELLTMLASGMAAAQASCIPAPGDEVRPYVREPEGARPGTPAFYATSMLTSGFATGLLVETHEGRPTKIDGNPLHPASLGGSLAQHQAALFDLYDPHRSKLVVRQGQPSSWQAVHEAVGGPAHELWVVLPRSSSPYRANILTQLRARRGVLHVVHGGDDLHLNAYQGAQLAFGQPVETQYELAKARRIVALDADFLAAMPMSVRWARDFAEGRRPDSEQMSRLYAFEPMLTPTGILADHRAAVAASDVLPLALALTLELQRPGSSVVELPEEISAAAKKRVRALGLGALLKTLAEDLYQHRHESVLIVGDRQPPACHALTQLMNVALGNVGHTITFTAPVLTSDPGERSLTDLQAALEANEVSALLVLERDLVHEMADSDHWADLLSRTERSVHAGMHRTRTARACTFHAPLSHFLESWGDGRAWDGTLSLIQPLIRPLYDSRSTDEVLAWLLGVRGEMREDLAKFHAAAAPNFGHALARGHVEDSRFPPIFVAPTTAPLVQELLCAASTFEASLGPLYELNLAASPTLGHGGLSNNAWLQELPHPVTKQCWGNAALMSPASASKLGVTDGQVVELEVDGRRLALPTLIVPEHADDTITVELGHGKRGALEPIASGVGERARALLGPDSSLILRNARVRPSSRHERLARTQTEFSPHHRDLAKVIHVAEERRARSLSLRQVQETEPSANSKTLQWAMTIDTSTCTGCSACVIACQAENNIPVVGKEAVARGREMHWLRLDLYRLKIGENTVVVQEPMLCQHCEHAPCEYVCPVFATTHSPDGLNEMVYNRCVGTRFCSNNCPYKVRRFNWLRADEQVNSLPLQRNPQVTVRERGVMEKCTYCVQRIRAAELNARMERREIRAGEVRTACQVACPTQAISFGALQHVDSPMVRGRREARAFSVLGELGTRPRTQYLAKVRNVHPAVGEEEA